MFLWEKSKYCFFLNFLHSESAFKSLINKIASSRKWLYKISSHSKVKLFNLPMQINTDESTQIVALVRFFGNPESLQRFTIQPWVKFWWIYEPVKRKWISRPQSNGNIYRFIKEISCCNHFLLQMNIFFPKIVCQKISVIIWNVAVTKRICMQYLG